MKRVVGALLLVGGILAVVFGGFSYTKSKHEATIGPIHLGVAEKGRVAIPVWAGAAAILGGVVLLALRDR